MDSTWIHEAIGRHADDESGCRSNQHLGTSLGVREMWYVWVLWLRNYVLNMWCIFGYSRFTSRVYAILNWVLYLELDFGFKMVGCFTPIQSSSLHVFAIFSGMGSPPRKQLLWMLLTAKPFRILLVLDHRHMTPGTIYPIHTNLHTFLICKIMNCDHSHELPILEAWTQRCVHASAEVVGHWPSTCCPAPRWWMWQASLR